ncbi:hypothetical protein OG496_00690 [Streptomyces sp. NBC_00988]|uniref:hypothetical protein n=1 Tax=Streptomyces sp. NBC_00988 TaxID=2903704 RepID=UPI003869FCF0|nr:hypothetical protein OG496_00690 [Streptomyces sp. NBC_00988]
MKYTAFRSYRAARWLATRMEEASRQPDRGDISITTVIIWVAAVGGALAIAGTIAVVIAKYNLSLSGI